MRALPRHWYCCSVVIFGAFLPLHPYIYVWVLLCYRNRPLGAGCLHIPNAWTHWVRAPSWGWAKAASSYCSLATNPALFHINLCVSVSRPCCDSRLHPTQRCVIREAVVLAGVGTVSDQVNHSQQRKAIKWGNWVLWYAVCNGIFFFLLLFKKETALTCKNALNFNLLYFQHLAADRCQPCLLLCVSSAQYVHSDW